MWFESKSKNVKVNRRSSRHAGTVLNMSPRNQRASKQQAALPTGALLVVGALLTAVVLWGGWMITRSLKGMLFQNNARFTIETVEAHTDGVLPEKILREWSQVDLGANLYAQDLSEVRERLEANAIIARATVRRELPGTLKIVVNERTPIARLGRDSRGMNWLVDAQGVILKKSFQAKHLPFLLGVTRHLVIGDRIYNEDNTRAREALRALDYVRNTKIVEQEVKVARISVGHPEYLDVRLDSGQRLLLNRKNLDKNLLRAAYMIQHDRINGLNRSTFDLRPDSVNAIGTTD